MRFVLYNVAYGTGGPHSSAHRLLTLHRYLRSGRRHIEQLHTFVRNLAPDIVGIVEIDSGSFRAGGCNHVMEMARHLSHEYTYCSKYHARSLGRVLPIFRHQTNALFSHSPLQECEHHMLPLGFKRLVVDAKVNGVRILLVHLALNRHTRGKQLFYLSRIVGGAKGPVIVAGDFNAFGGPTELAQLTAATGLNNINLDCHPTYPSWRPKKELDFVLCSPEVRVEEFRVLQDVRLSDHLPLLLDFTVI